MDKALEFISGKKTYLVTAAGIVYLVACQFTGKTPDESILGIFGFLGVSFLRMGVSKTAQAVQQMKESLPEQPKAEG
jgi:hypothetical protein